LYHTFRGQTLQFCPGRNFCLSAPSDYYDPFRPVFLCGGLFIIPLRPVILCSGLFIIPLRPVFLCGSLFIVPLRPVFLCSGLFIIPLSRPAE